MRPLYYHSANSLPQKSDFFGCVVFSISDLITLPEGHHPSHIARLPSELLLRIFSVFARLRCRRDQRSECYCTGRCISLPWIKTTYVCHHWRELALASPTIWASSTWDLPKDMPFEWIERLTLRAAPMPISLKVSFLTDTRASQKVTFMRENLHRIANLSVASDGDHNGIPSMEILSIFSEAAPSLNRLSLKISPRRPPSSLPPFHQATSRLQELKLEGCKFFALDPETRIFENLTSLKVRLCSEESASLRELHVALSTMPSLEKLVVYLNAIPDVAIESPRSLSHLTLLHLHSLTLCVSVQALTTLLDSWSIPSVTFLELTIRCEIPFISDLDRALSTLSSRHSHIPVLSKSWPLLDVWDSPTTHVFDTLIAIYNEDRTFSMSVEITDPVIRQPSGTYVELALVSLLTKLPMVDRVQKLSGEVWYFLWRPDIWSQACSRMSSLTDVSDLLGHYDEEQNSLIQEAALRAAKGS